MLSPDAAKPKKSLRNNPLFYSSLLLACVALYVAYLLYARHQSNLRYQEQTRKQQDEQRRESDRNAVEQLGGSELSIRGFYVSPAAIRPGQSAQICYDVANAKNVTFDPPVAAVWPSHSRCFEVSPKKTTTYTLSIADAAGKTLSASVELQVK